ncbi:MAG: CehA/McbA family metallohydrolase [Pirellulales bacterium]
MSESPKDLFVIRSHSGVPGVVRKPNNCWIFVGLILLLGALLATTVEAESKVPQDSQVEVQPLLVQVGRLTEALESIGQPLDKASISLLAKAQKADDKEARQLVQQALDPYCLFAVTISPESRVKVQPGIAEPLLVEKGWSQFLVKVQNQAGVTAALNVHSPQARKLAGAEQDDLRDRWMEANLFRDRPLNPKLSGIELEYRILQLYSRDAGKRSAVFSFDVGQGTQDLGFRNDTTVTFDCRAAIPVTVHVLDENGEPTVAAFEIRDDGRRVYPAQSKRLAPDFFFQPQIYRRDRETIELPEGEFEVTITRGPEYLPQNVRWKIDKESTAKMIKLQRWVDPAALGWWSGDHHIHAAGCAHYEKPTEGVHAPDMIRHCLGEDLKVGVNLTWGPCFDYQKQFFTGKDDLVSRHPYLLHYDVEVSGFGSHESGHLCLLRLKEQIPPGGESKHHWPKLCLNTLRWAKKQGAVCGPAHSGAGLSVDTDELPNYIVPPFNSIGANEYIADVTHTVEGPDGSQVPAVDFISTVDTPYVWELNIWYHTLNCGYRTRISGETDFPCVYGERVGIGRSYAKVEGKLNYGDWCEAIRNGAAYVSDGHSHLLDFQVNDVELGRQNELRLERPGEIEVSAKVAARLSDDPDEEIHKRPYDQKPYWHLERARLDDRNVKVELIVNGRPVEEQVVKADGALNDVLFNTEIDRSSWVAIRILPSSHTNPIFVVVDDKPVRASRRSAQWCIDGVSKCRKEKERFMDEDERDDFHQAYDHALTEYRRILGECETD